ncbi:MAG: hypothetical protein U1F67_23475 [Rubrivivax sp.]
MQAWKIYAALAWARANGLNRVVVDAPQAKLGVMAGGKAWADLREAMRLLGLSDAQATTLGVRVMKIGMPWPLEADAVRCFAGGLLGDPRRRGEAADHRVPVEGDAVRAARRRAAARAGQVRRRRRMAGAARALAAATDR